MTAVSSTSASPAVAQAVLPASLRDATTERKDAFRQALAFERVLLGQMTESMMKTTGGDDKDTPAAVKAMKDNLPGLLADALTVSGGIGLATQLDALAQAGSVKTTSLSSQTATSGGAAAGTPSPASAADGAGGATA